MDWAGLMRLGLGDLRLEPRAFWRLTPVELLLMSGRDRAGGALGRAGLDALMRSYPDDMERVSDGQ